MPTHWRTTDDLPPDVRNKLSTLANCFTLDGTLVSRGSGSSVVRCTVGEQTVYIKRYTRAGSFLRQYLGRSRARAEWENLQLFHGLGIDTPRLMAYGEERRHGRFLRGALVTEEVPGAQSLFQLACTGHPALKDRRLFRQIATRIAFFTRTLHERGFAHNDLDWRNILVVLPEGERPLQVLFFDCPGGRFWFGTFLEHRIAKDLAHLDKLARVYLPLHWRLWFYRQYAGNKHLTTGDRQRLHKISTFFDESRYRGLLRW